MSAKEVLFGYVIKNGPDRANLIYAFVHARDNCSSRPISFEVVKNCITRDGKESYQVIPTRNVKITGLKYDGNSKYAFVVEGSIDIYHLENRNNEEPLNCKFMACYDAMTGQGRANLLIG